MDTLTADPREEATQQRVNSAVEAMEQRFSAMQAAGAALAAATDENREELQAAFDTACREFDAAESAVFAAEEDAERVRRMVAARSKKKTLGTSTPAGSIRVGDEPLTYQRFQGRADRPDDPSFFYFRDLWKAQTQGDRAAAERLQRHMKEMEVEGRALSSADNAGGEFIPPLWMQNEWVNVARAGRAFANAVRNLPLPAGTDSINLPRLATGADVAAQASEGDTVHSTDPTTDSVSAGVKTVAGQVTLSQQLIDRSNPAFDEVVFGDLALAYATKVDVYCLTGSGSSGQPTGIITMSGSISVTYTDASPTVPEFYPKGADAVQQILTNRFLPPEVWIMHPRRWFWMLAALDSSNRPLVVPSSGGAQFNGMAIADRVGAENIVGTWHGLPVLLDPNVPTTRGSGTNEDVILGSRVSDLLLFEDGAPRNRALEQTLGDKLQVILQVYGYMAFMPDRYKKATAVISGTGLATPTF